MTATAKRQGGAEAEREKPHQTRQFPEKPHPLRTFYSGEERKKPGFWQIDTVHHCGQATSGQYLHTLTATDIASGWIELHSLLNNAQKWTFEALAHIKATAVRCYAGYDCLEGLEEQVLLAAVYEPLSPLPNSFMPTQKLSSKTRVGSKEIKVYYEPKSPFQRLMESSEVSQKIKKSLSAQIALYNPVELQHNVNKAIPRLRQRLAQSNRKITKG